MCACVHACVRACVHAHSQGWARDALGHRSLPPLAYRDAAHWKAVADRGWMKPIQMVELNFTAARHRTKDNTAQNRITRHNRSTRGPHHMAYHGTNCPAWHDTAGQGMAQHGRARHGTAVHGKKALVWPDTAPHGTTLQRITRHCTAPHYNTHHHTALGHTAPHHTA